MIDLIFPVMAVAFVIVATPAAVANEDFTAGQRHSRQVVNGSLTAALVSVELTAWFFFWPPA